MATLQYNYSFYFFLKGIKLKMLEIISSRQNETNKIGMQHFGPWVLEWTVYFP